MPVLPTLSLSLSLSPLSPLSRAQVLYFLLLCHFYSMPLPMVRDFLRAFKDVWSELQNVVASRRLRLQINRMLRAPTDADLARYDPSCAVCHDDVTPVTRDTS